VEVVHWKRNLIFQKIGKVEVGLVRGYTNGVIGSRKKWWEGYCCQFLAEVQNGEEGT
jgi:hypothetical protein